MKPWQKGMMINGRKFGFMELRAFCHEKTGAGSAPGWKAEVCRFILDWLGDDSDIVQYSSGTTGKSKEIRLSKLSMMASAEKTCRYFHLEHGQTALLCLPVAYIAGKMMVVRSLVGSLDLQMARPDSHPDLSAMPPVEFAAMLPLQVRNALESKGELSSVRKLIIGGAEISPALEKQLQLHQVEAYATFGMAETCSHVAIRRLNGASPEKAYQAMPGISLEKDARGCLVIDAPYLSGQIVTNDLVQFKGKGSFIWLGRFDNLINTGGIKIVPEEMEAVIRMKTGLECAIIGLPDERYGQKLVLVLERSRKPGSIRELPADFPQWFPRNRQPKEVVWLNHLPRNQSYKTDRNKLELILGNLYDPND